MTSRFNHQAALAFRKPTDLFISRKKKGGTFTHTFIGRWEDDPFMVTPTRPPNPFVVAGRVVT